MKSSIALAISVLFHPLFIALYTTLYFITYIYNTLNPVDTLDLINQILLSTVFLPLITYITLKQLNYIKSMMTATTKERVLPLVVNVFLLTHLIGQLEAIKNNSLFVFFIGCLFATLLALYYNKNRIKVSLHMIGIGVFSFFLFFHTSDLITQTISIVIIGLVASSRLILKAHTIKELTIGLSIALTSQTIAHLLFYKI